MRRARILPLCCLVTVGFSAAQGITLYSGSLKTMKCSRNVEITVVSDGGPMKGVKVDFCKLPLESACASGVSDDKGTSMVSQLLPGKYSVVATTRNGVSTSEFSFRASHSSKMTRFTVDMTSEITYSRLLMEYADKLPIQSSVMQFQGFARDIDGSGIEGATIRVVRKGDKEGESAVLLRSDKDGHFSTPLEQGSYIAFFRKTGFVLQPIPFEIVPNGENNLTVRPTRIAQLLPY